MITWVFVPLDLILPDQPNSAVRHQYAAWCVEGGSCEAPPYPDGCYNVRFELTVMPIFYQGINVLGLLYYKLKSFFF